MTNTPAFETPAPFEDPYKNYRFKMKWNGNYVAGVSELSGLNRDVAAIKHRTGADLGGTKLSPGQSTFSPITLERGVTSDVDFLQWANKVWDYKSAVAGEQDVPLKDFRRDLVIELFNEAGQKVIAFNVSRCWVSEFQALPELDGGGNTVAIETLKLENEGWERDQGVTEPIAAPDPSA